MKEKAVRSTMVVALRSIDNLITHINVALDSLSDPVSLYREGLQTNSRVSDPTVEDGSNQNAVSKDAAAEGPTTLIRLRLHFRVAVIDE